MLGPRRKTGMLRPYAGVDDADDDIVTGVIATAQLVPQRRLRR